MNEKEEPAPTSEDSTASQRRVQLETENLISTYEQVAEWIRFADAKAAVVITVSGAMVGAILPTMNNFLKSRKAEEMASDPVRIMAVSLFGVFLVVALVTCFYAFRCILPFRMGGEHPALNQCSHFHPAAIAARYGIGAHEQFITDYSKVGVSGFQQEVLAGLLIDSHISSHKYKHVTQAIRMLAVLAGVAFLYLLAIQF